MPRKPPSFTPEWFLQSQDEDGVGLLAVISQVILGDGKILVFSTSTFDQ